MHSDGPYWRGGNLAGSHVIIVKPTLRKFLTTAHQLKPGSHSHDFTGDHRRLEGIVGSSVVYCRRCCRAWSSVVAWFVVALFGRL